jgi:hypothetical protein
MSVSAIMDGITSVCPGMKIKSFSAETYPD